MVNLLNEPEQNARPLFFWIALGFGILLPCLFVIPVRVALVTRGAEKVIGWRAVERASGWFVESVDVRGPAAGALLPGDRIRGIDGDLRTARIGPDWLLQRIPPGQTYEIEFERQGEVRNRQLRLDTAVNETAAGWSIVYVLVAFAFYAASLTIALAKPQDPTAKHAFSVGSLCTLMLLAYASAPSIGVLPGFYTWAALLMASVSPLHFVSGFHFYAGVPVRIPADRFWRRVGAALTVCGLVLWAPAAFYNVVQAAQSETAVALVDRYYPLFRFYAHVLAPAQLVYKAVGAVAILGVVARNFRLRPEGDQRRRIRWLIWGAALGLSPIGLVALVTAIISILPGGQELGQTLAMAKAVASAMGVAIPITIGYAIVKHRVLGVDIAVRLGVRYLLARNVLRVILLLPILGIVLSVVSHPNVTVGELLFRGKFNLLLIALASVGLAYRRPLAALVDKRFFREAYDQEQVLLHLIESLKSVDSIQDISRLFSGAIDSALHARRISVFYRAEFDRDFRLVHSSSGTDMVRHLPENSALISLLGAGNHAQHYMAVRKQCPEEERDWLDQLQLQLVVPVPGTDGKLLGVLMLGEKMSEEPYTGRDRKLLEAVAAQIGVVYENLSLRDRVKRQQQVQANVLAHLQQSDVNIVKECPQCGNCYDSAVEQCARDGAALMLTLPVERTIDGKYRLERLIGKGGMGAVYQAADLRLGRTVAVKVMIGSLFGNVVALRRFAREAQASAKLDHPNIVRIYDFGELHGDGAYLVLEYVPSKTWRHELHRLGVFRPPYAADAFDQLLSGLEAAHRGGVVHRDLKPENILISSLRAASPPLVKVLDFGLAKVREGGFLDPHSQTITGRMIGTWGYASPEQMMGEEVDERTDIYAVGVLALETLTGELGPRRHQLGIEDLMGQRFAFKNIQQGHLGVRRVLAKCVASRREARYASVAEVRESLIPALRQCPAIPVSTEAGTPARVFGAVARDTLTFGLPEERQS
jgi:hypothetical protein